MITRTLKKSGYALAPRYFVNKYTQFKMLKEARSLSRLRNDGADPLPLMESLWASHFFRPLQKKLEILQLLRLVRDLRPSSICEIGAAGCGTTFLLMQAAPRDANIVSVDLAYTATREAALKSFAAPQQKIFCMREDSHLSQTALLVDEWLAGRKLDVLFLDGDHSYEGIKRDFELYSPLVRSGGVIVFHDIVLDYKTRYGIKTSTVVGGVPQFWQEIKSSYADVEEIVADYEQDGFGIGIVHWNGAAL